MEGRKVVFLTSGLQSAFNFFFYNTNILPNNLKMTNLLQRFDTRPRFHSKIDVNAHVRGGKWITVA